MSTTSIKNPSERKKLIAAVVLGVVAIVVLWWAFIGFGSSSPAPTKQATTRPGTTTAPTTSTTTTASNGKPQTPTEIKGDDLAQLVPIVYQQPNIVVPEPKRNIFAYYEPPPPPPPSVSTPTPTPTPTPPVTMTSISPTNVYARTGDFTLEVTGDKFTSEVRIYIDNRELPTKFQGEQKLSAIVPAAIIANPGQRQVVVRSPDNRLYSNSGLGFSVTPPPAPNYSYIGILGDKHYSHDVAILQDKSNKELVNVQRGDMLSGRFRVTSISEKEIVLTDTGLKIKHSLAMVADATPGLGPLARPTPKVDAEDDEP
jgi:hypothetical protein